MLDAEESDLAGFEEIVEEGDEGEDELLGSEEIDMSGLPDEFESGTAYTGYMAKMELEGGDAIVGGDVPKSTAPLVDDIPSEVLAAEVSVATS